MSKKEIPFELMHGAGNIFMVINNNALHLSLDELSEFLTKEYPLHFPVDGLMAHRISDVNDYEFLIDFFNPDGSHGAMCGNGARCAIKYHEEYFVELPNESNNVNFMMAGTIYSGIYLISDNYVSVTFPNVPMMKELQLKTDNGIVHAFHVNNGSDHLIIDAVNHGIDVNDFFSFDFRSFAEPLRHHPDLPSGANVNIAMTMPNNLIKLRTFERGVERETAACGTGALATAYIYHNHKMNTNLTVFNGIYPIELQVQSGDILTVEKEQDSEALRLIGPAEFLTIDEAFAMYSDFQQRIQ
jgi:diaminopimelate epimerase